MKLFVTQNFMNPLRVLLAHGKIQYPPCGMIG